MIPDDDADRRRLYELLHGVEHDLRQLLEGAKEDQSRRLNALVEEATFESPDRDETWRKGYGVTGIELLFLVRLIVKTVTARLEAGHDPEDVLWTVAQIIEHTQHALVDGRYPSRMINHDFHKQSVKVLEDKIAARDSDIETQERRISFLEQYNSAIREVCAPSKLKKVDDEWTERWGREDY